MYEADIQAAYARALATVDQQIALITAQPAQPYWEERLVELNQLRDEINEAILPYDV